MTQALSMIANPAANLSARFAPLIGRTALSSIFLMSGISKIQNYAATQGYMESVGVPGALLPAAIAFDFVLPVGVTAVQPIFKKYGE